jgi:hypothetical protein
MDPDPESGSAIRKNDGSGSGSALNQCGSETLVARLSLIRVFNTALQSREDLNLNLRFSELCVRCRSKFGQKYFLHFLRPMVSRPLSAYVAHFSIFEIYLNSNPESSRSWQPDTLTTWPPLSN